MVDIFDEVEEDLRAERAARLLKQYGWLIIAFAVAVIAAVVGWQVWTRYQAQQDSTAAARYIAAQNATQTPGAAAKDQLPVLDQLAATAPQGYRTLARLRAAAVKADAGDGAGAIAMWNEVAADTSADTLLRDFASLSATGHQIDHGDPAQLESRLKPLADLANPWSGLAREQLALLDLRQGRTDQARKALQALSIDIGAPAGLRARAGAMLTGLGSPDSK